MVSLPGWRQLKIGDVVRQIENRERIAPDRQYAMAGVKWYGEGVFLRETVFGSDMSANHVSPLVPGALIYNRLFAWKASFAVVPDEAAGWCVSSEFPQFAVDAKLATPDYLRHFCLTKPTLDAVNRASAGSAAVSRNRLKESAFLDLDIALPPLTTQRAIVEHWDKAQAYAARTKNRLELARKQLDDWLRKRTKVDMLQRSCFALNFSDFATWDFMSAKAAAFRIAHPDFVPFGAYAEESTELINPRNDAAMEWPVYGVSNTDGVFFSHLQKGSEFNSTYKRIRENWFFHNPTRSSVGSLGIVGDVPENAITSPEYQVWKLKDLGANTLNPLFVAVLIRTAWFTQLIQFHRVGAVKQRLFVENLLSIPVPQFPKDLQERISDEYRRYLDEHENSDRMLEAARAEVEAMILGLKPAP